MAVKRGKETEGAESESSTRDGRSQALQLTKSSPVPQLVDTTRAAEILGRSPATLKRWRYEGVGPSWIEMEGRVSYDVAVLLEHIRRNTRTPSVQAVLDDARGIA
jgi:hypothetical protein